MANLHPSKLSLNLRALMAREKVSIARLAELTQTKPTTLHGYIHGIHPQTLDILKKLSVFFTVSLDELLYGSPLDSPVRDPSKTQNTGTQIEGRYELTLEIKKLQNSNPTK